MKTRNRALPLLAFAGLAVLAWVILTPPQKVSRILVLE